MATVRGCTGCLPAMPPKADLHCCRNLSSASRLLRRQCRLFGPRPDAAMAVRCRVRQRWFRCSTVYVSAEASVPKDSTANISTLPLLHGRSLLRRRPRLGNPADSRLLCIMSHWSVRLA